MWSPTPIRIGMALTPVWGEIPAKGWRIHPHPWVWLFAAGVIRIRLEIETVGSSIKYPDANFGKECTRKETAKYLQSVGRD